MTTPFDVSIDLTVHAVPAGVAHDAAAERVRSAVASLPGARWVSVKWCVSAPAHCRWVTIYKPGNALHQAEGTWAHLATVVTTAAGCAIAHDAVP